jgi:hypothetical protein
LHTKKPPKNPQIFPSCKEKHISAENIQSVSGGYSKSFFLRKRAGGNAIVGTFDDSNKKSPQKLDGNSKMNPTQNRKTVI